MRCDAPCAAVEEGVRYKNRQQMFTQQEGGKQRPKAKQNFYKTQKNKKTNKDNKLISILNVWRLRVYCTKKCVFLTAILGRGRHPCPRKISGARGLTLNAALPQFGGDLLTESPRELSLISSQDSETSPMRTTMVFKFLPCQLKEQSTTPWNQSVCSERRQIVL